MTVLPANGGAYFVSLVVDPTDTQRIFAADAGGGIWRATNGGRSWRQVLAAGFMPHLLAIDPIQPQNVYAASSEIGVVHSGGGGRTWEALRRGLPLLASPNHQLSTDPRRAGTVYLATTTNGVLAYTLN